MKKRKLSKKKVNLLLIFLVVDIFVLFTIFKPSNATYVSDALGKAEMEVALYAFSYKGLIELDGVDGNIVSESVDINLGDMSPGDTKYYKFDVYNYVTDEEKDIDFSSETTISYKLKIITTTNLPLTYELYLNQGIKENEKSSLIGGANPNSNADIITDGYGTYYRVFPLDERCFKLDTKKLKVDEYTLVVRFPDTYTDVMYQDLIESIKIQLESKQVLPGDSVLNEGICR